MHEAGAGLGRDVIADQNGHVVVVAATAQRMRGHRAGKLTALQHAIDVMRRDTNILAELRQQIERHQRA